MPSRPPPADAPALVWNADQLTPLFPDAVLEAGRRLWRSGRVERVQPRQGGRVVTGIVGGTGASRRVYARVSRAGDVLSLDGECTCAGGGRCEHVAATLLALAEDGAPAPPSGSEPAVDLPPRLAGWIAALDRVGAGAAGDDAPPGVRERLLYALESGLGPSGIELRVRVQLARLMANGAYGEMRDFAPEPALLGEPPPFVLAPDRRILRELVAMGYGRDGGRLGGADGAALLGRLLATRRCSWRGAGAKSPAVALRPGPARQARPAWEVDGEGVQHLVFRAGEGGAMTLPLEPPWYLDRLSGECGPLETGLPAPVAALLAEAPPVAPDAAPALARALKARAHGAMLPVPRALPIEVAADMAPVPCLILFSERIEGPEPAWQDYGVVQFDYAGAPAGIGDPRDPLDCLVDGRIRRVHRQRATEQAHVDTLIRHGLRLAPSRPNPGETAARWTLSAGAAAWHRFLLDGVPALTRAGWTVTLAEGFRHQLVHAEAWHLDLQAEDAVGLSLGLRVTVGEEQIDLLPVIVAYLQDLPEQLGLAVLRERLAEPTVFLPLSGGRVLPMASDRLRAIVETLVELAAGTRPSGGRLSLPMAQLGRLDELAKALPEWRWQGDGPLRDRASRAVPRPRAERLAAPPGLRAALRPYQETGLAWLAAWRDHGLGGLLADDMGLGKTIQTLAHLLAEKQQGRAEGLPSLVVAPTTLLPNWRREAEAFAPDLRVLVLHGPHRHGRFEALAGHDLVLTSYPLLLRDIERLAGCRFHYLVLDEAQHIKNPRSQLRAAAQQLQARQRLGLTGTPMENNLGELWSLLDFLNPGVLGSEAQFSRCYRQPVERDGDTVRREALARRIAPVLLRRTKDRVARELPPKTEVIQRVSLEDAQADLYETVRASVLPVVRAALEHLGVDGNRMRVLNALLKLRQVCCDPRLVDVEAARLTVSSAKLDWLRETLPELIAEGRRVLLFSQFTSMLALIEAELAKLGLGYAVLTGQTRDRREPVERFQSGAVPLFLISLKAGGTGLNLTAADTVIHYDPWWNPAAEGQATDRAHRLGQTKPVLVYKLIAEGTVEEHIQRLQAEKRELAKALLAEHAASHVLDGAALERLFAPLNGGLDA